MADSEEFATTCERGFSLIEAEDEDHESTTERIHENG